MPLPYQRKVNIFMLYIISDIKKVGNSTVASTFLLLEIRKMTGFWLLTTFSTRKSVLLLPQFMPFLMTV